MNDNMNNDNNDNMNNDNDNMNEDTSMANNSNEDSIEMASDNSNEDTSMIDNSNEDTSIEMASDNSNEDADDTNEDTSIKTASDDTNEDTHAEMASDATDDATDDGMEDTVASSGAKPWRWTSEEIEFLASQKAAGLSRKQCVEAYQARYDNGRSEASIALKVPTNSRSAGTAQTRPANYPKPMKRPIVSHASTYTAPVKAAPPVHTAPAKMEPAEVAGPNELRHALNEFNQLFQSVNGYRQLLKGKDLECFQTMTAPLLNILTQ